MMNTERDPYWDDLGIAWLADPNPKAIEAQLNVRLRAQALWAHLLMAGGFLLSFTLLGLGAFTTYIGINGGTWNFVVRGIALLLLSGLAGFAAWSQRTKVRDDREAVLRVIDLSIARSRNLRRAAGMGIAMCGVAAVFGIAGYIVRVHGGHPPAMSPLEPLALLALMSAALFLYLRYTAQEVKRLCYLQRALSPEST